MPEGAEETTEECIARGELRNSTAGEYLISGFDAEYGGVDRNVRAPRVKLSKLFQFLESLTFEEFTSKLVERFYSGKTREDYRLSCEPGVKRRMRISKDLPIM